MDIDNEGLLLEVIAKHLWNDHNTVTKAIAFWCETSLSVVLICYGCITSLVRWWSGFESQLHLLIDRHTSPEKQRSFNTLHLVCRRDMLRASNRKGTGPMESDHV